MFDFLFHLLGKFHDCLIILHNFEAGLELNWFVRRNFRSSMEALQELFYLRI